MLSYSAMLYIFSVHCPSEKEKGKEKEGGREGGRMRGRSEEGRLRGGWEGKEREKDLLVSKLFTENINSTKSIKRAFFSLE